MSKKYTKAYQQEFKLDMYSFDACAETVEELRTGYKEEIDDFLDEIETILSSEKVEDVRINSEFSDDSYNYGCTCCDNTPDYRVRIVVTGTIAMTEKEIKKEVLKDKKIRAAAATARAAKAAKKEKAEKAQLERLRKKYDKK